MNGNRTTSINIKPLNNQNRNWKFIKAGLQAPFLRHGKQLNASKTAAEFLHHTTATKCSQTTMWKKLTDQFNTQVTSNRLLIYSKYWIILDSGEISDAANKCFFGPFTYVYMKGNITTVLITMQMLRSSVTPLYDNWEDSANPKHPTAGTPEPFTTLDRINLLIPKETLSARCINS